MDDNGFFKLQNIPTPILADGFALDTLVLEREMESNNGGILLETIDDHYIPYFNSDAPFKKYVPFFTEFNSNKIKELVSRYPNITEPCSMVISSIEELMVPMSIGYQVAHFNYILGKKYNLKDSFPKKCCGISSVNVTLSLMDFGYPNATYAYSWNTDHGYVVLPFVFHKDKEEVKGTIIIDPTSDQLHRSQNRVRNAVFLRMGTKWEYTTDWASGQNLFPNRMYSIELMKNEPNLPWTWYEDYPAEASDGQLFFQRAFANQVKIEKH